MAKSLKTFKKELLARPGVRKAYEDLAPEYAIASAIIKARVNCGLTQEQLAKRMNTKQSFIARLESGRMLPSLKTLYRVAEATGTRASFELA